MTWQVATAVYLTLGTVVFLLRRQLARDFIVYNRLINFIFFAFALYPAGLVYAFFIPHNLEIGVYAFLILAAGSLIFPVINLASFRANEHLDAGIYSILGNLAPIITLATANLWLHERLTNTQLLGALFIIVSATIVAFPNVHHHPGRHVKGLKWGLFSVIAAGVAITFERYMLSRIDFGTYLIYGWGAQTLWMTLLAKNQLRHLKKLNRSKAAKTVYAYAFLSTFRSIGFITALKLSSASLVSAITSFLAVSVVLASFIFLKERKALPLKLLSALVGAIGLFIITR